MAAFVVALRSLTLAKRRPERSGRPYGKNFERAKGHYDLSARECTTGGSQYGGDVFLGIPWVIFDLLLIPLNLPFDVLAVL